MEVGDEVYVYSQQGFSFKATIVNENGKVRDGQGNEYERGEIFAYGVKDEND